MTDIDSVAVGKRIKEIRSTLFFKKISMKDFGALLDPPADKTLVSKWENGVYVPNNVRLKQIADMANTTIEYLLFGIIEEKTGYGERIKKIREDELNMTKAEFGKSFIPPVSEQIVDKWENESLLPSFLQLKVMAQDGHNSPKEILFGERRYKNAANPYTSLDDTEEKLENSTLNQLERADSDYLFRHFNQLRLCQIENKTAFNELSSIINSLHYAYYEENLNTDRINEIESEVIESVTNFFDSIKP